MDIMIWMEDEDMPVAVATSIRGRQAMSALMFTEHPMYSLAISATPEELLASLPEGVSVVFYDGHLMTNVDSESKALQ